MTAPDLAPEQAVERLVVHLGAALQQRAVYPPGHPQLVKAIDSAAAAHGALLAAAGARETVIMVVEERLLVDRRPVPEEATWARALLAWLLRLRITGLTIAAGFDRDELTAFLDGAQRPEGPAPSAHLSIGCGAIILVAEEVAVDRERDSGRSMAQSPADFHHIKPGGDQGGGMAVPQRMESHLG